MGPAFRRRRRLGAGPPPALAPASWDQVYPVFPQPPLPPQPPQPLPNPRLTTMLGAWDVLTSFTPEAEQRAKALFLSSLSPVQRQEWHKYGYITVMGSDRGRYLISYGRDHNVYSTGEQLVLCARPTGVPTWDIMLAQKLLIATDVATFLLHANPARRQPWVFMDGAKKVRDQLGKLGKL